MEIIKASPPNADVLRAFFPITDPSFNPLFAFGDLLYNPNSIDIPEDVMFHEQIHSDQQRACTSPEVWWNKYIFDRDFRLNQEVEAYAAQYRFLKPFLSNSILKQALFEFASNLSGPLYQLGITYSQAESMIRSKRISK